MTQRNLVRLTVSVLVKRGDALLFIREQEGGREFFSEPVGHVEKRESPSDAAAREAVEETGVAVSINRLYGVYLVTHDSGELSDSIRLVYLADYRSGELRPTEDIHPEWRPLNQFSSIWGKVTRSASRMAVSRYLDEAAGQKLESKPLNEDTCIAIYQSSLTGK
jgi:ADP-ribose pyrophosphatase YjhB (NUDIX family)